mmetsp:Transcript_30463/g.47312  ORF Transcript_30463/g.47312 Transcript_30463/m.47312 type:complete len:226 (-) Transcript_30463:279-956(-)
MDIIFEDTTHSKTSSEQSAHKVGVSVENTLGHTSGTRGVHDDSQSVRFGGNIFMVIFFTQLLQVIKGAQVDSITRHTLRDTINHNNGLKSRAVGSNTQQFVQTSRGSDNQRKFSVVDDVLNSSRAKGIVESDSGQGLGVASKVSQNPRERVLGVDTNGVLRLDTEMTQTRGNMVSAFGDLLKGGPLVSILTSHSKARTVSISMSSPLEARVKGDFIVLGTSKLFL